MGFVKFYQTGPSASPLLILTTGASVNLTLEPIYSSAVWGAGWYNAASSSHYADHALRYEGSVEIELQATNELWNFLRDFASEQRAYPRSAEISPDGQRIYKFITTGAYDSTFDNNGMWCTSLSFSTSEGSFVTSSVGVVGLHRVVDTGGNVYIDNRTGVTTADEIMTTYPLNPCSANISPIPFWRTDAKLVDLGDCSTYPYPQYPPYTPFNTYTSSDEFQDDLEVIEWSIDVTNNHTILYTCNGVKEATAVLMGAIDASGSVTLYSPTGVFDPIVGDGTQGTETNPYIYAQRTVFQVEIQRSPASSNPVYIELPAPVVESDDYGVKGQNDVTTRGFGLKGLGGRTNAPTNTIIYPPFMMSQAT